MTSLPTRELKIGKIIDKTLAVLERNTGPALIYLLVLTVVGAGIGYVSAGSTAPLQIAGGQLLKTVIGMVCGYFLLVAMLRRTGLQSQTAEDTLLPFLGMSILSSLAVLLGMIAFVLPGIFLMTRWSIAQPLMVAEGGGVMASLGASWDRTRGNEFSIILAGIALVALPVVAIIVAGSFFEQGSIAAIVVSEVLTSGISLLLLAMGTALYGLIVGGDATAKVFA